MLPETVTIRESSRDGRKIVSRHVAYRYCTGKTGTIVYTGTGPVKRHRGVKPHTRRWDGRGPRAGRRAAAGGKRHDTRDVKSALVTTPEVGPSVLAAA